MGRRLLHVEAGLVVAELGEGCLNLGADAHVAQLLRETVNDDREEHVAGGVSLVIRQRCFGVRTEPFVKLLTDGGEAVERDVLKKFHGRSG